MTTYLSLYAIGFTDTEARIIKSICLLSQSANRSFSYQAMDDAKIDHVMPDIVIVNADDPDTIATWQTKYANYPQIISILAAKGKLSVTTSYYLKRPLVALALRNLLDKIAQAEYSQPAKHPTRQFSRSHALRGSERAAGF